MPAREVAQRFFALRRAIQAASATRDRLPFFALDRRAAHRTLRWQLDFARIVRTAIDDDFDDFGNHIAGATDDDGIADAHILASHFVHVVQRRVADCHTADEHWL